jgi:heptosyltransferase II
MMISYAQNNEDVMLARAFRDRTKGFYIDIGAMDPVEGSITKHFYDLGWCGVNIEPDQRFCDRLQKSRPRDINLSVALGAHTESRTFYQFDEQGISTFNLEFAEYFTQRGFACRPVSLPMTTLAKVCTTYVREQVDFLKIDAEGWEGPIIEGANWKRFRPKIVVIEATKPYSHTPTWEAWEPQVLGNNYSLVYYDGLNRFYVCEEASDLKSAFQYPPNVLDGFTPYPLARMVQERAELEERLTECEQERRKKLEALLLAGHLAQERASIHRSFESKAAEVQAAMRRVRELEEEIARQRNEIEILSLRVLAQ